MIASLILEAYSGLIEAFKRIETSEALLKVIQDADVRQIVKQQQQEAVAQFEQILDRQIDARLDEIMTIARKELLTKKGREKASKKRYTEPGYAELLAQEEQRRTNVKKQGA